MLKVIGQDTAEIEKLKKKKTFFLSNLSFFFPYWCFFYCNFSFVLVINLIFFWAACVFQVIKSHQGLLDESLICPMNAQVKMVGNIIVWRRGISTCSCLFQRIKQTGEDSLV